MKQLLKMVVGAVALALPATTQAQMPVDPSVVVNIAATPATFQTGGRGYGGDGGGFFANFTVNFPAPTGPVTFNNYLIWCIDAGRSVTLPGTYTYALYRAVDFANSTTLLSTNNYDPSVTDMQRIASLQSQLETATIPSLNAFDIQGSIWSIFDGYTTYGGNPNNAAIIAGNPNFSISNYYVLWNGSNQSFLVEIPEPSSALLLAIAGMGIALLVVRRRNMA